MPFAGYKNFADCVAKNQSKSNPKAYCATIMRKVEGKKEIKFTHSKIQLKEEGKTFHSEGFICTTHPDRDYKEDTETEGDILSEAVIDKIVDTLNDPQKAGHPETTQVSYRHDYLKEEDSDLDPAGVNNSVEKRQTEDGHWGVFVDTEHTTTYADKDKLVYEIEKKIIPGYSIEYDATDFDIVEHDGKPHRFIKDIDFYGYGFANGRKIANPQAAITAAGYKEMVDSFKEDHSHKKDKKKIIKLDKKAMEAKKMKKEIKEEKPAEEQPAEEKNEAQPEDKGKEKPEEKKEDKKDEKEMKDYQSYKDFQAAKKSFKEKVETEVKEGKPRLPNKDKIEGKEVEGAERISFKEAVFGNKEGKKAPLDVQWKEAANLHTALDRKNLMNYSSNNRVGEQSSPFTVKTKEINMKDVYGTPTTRTTQEIQYKTLTTDSNYVGAQTTYWDALDNYEQTPAELNDVYGPIIISQFNEMTTAWNLLPKDDMSTASAIRFRVKTARPVSDGSKSYGSTPTYDSRAGRQKININFVTYRQDIAVEFEEIELAKSPGGIGDVYAEEIKDGTETMMNTVNSDLLTSATTPAEGEPYTFETTIKTTGNLYGKALATYTALQAASVTNASSQPLTLERMRKMVDDVKSRGAQEGNLVFIGHYTQSRKYKTLIQNLQRTVPTSARAGFTGRPELDGVPFFEDFQANTDDLWLIDIKHTRVGMKKAPTYVEFGLSQMKRNGVVWMMANVFSNKPGNNAWTYGLKTT